MNFCDYKKVFIDCGGHKGESVKKARKIFGNDTLIVTFEPNKVLHHFYEEDQFSENFVLIKKGVSFQDEIREFYDNEGGTQCFTSDSSMISASSIKSVEKIECVNLSDWIKNNLTTDQKIMLKLDVEGLEYKILPSLISGNLLDGFIDELYIDFHAHRMFVDARKFDIKTVDELMRVSSYSQTANLATLSIHNGVLFNILEHTKNIFHWDALVESRDYHPPVYYLAYDIANHKFDRKTLKIK